MSVKNNTIYTQKTPRNTQLIHKRFDLFRTIANYLMWRVVKSKFLQLSSDFIEIFKSYYLQAFNYWSDSDQHQLCLMTTSQKFGIPLSKVFLDQKFYGDSKKLVSKKKPHKYDTVFSRPYLVFHSDFSSLPFNGSM